MSHNLQNTTEHKVYKAYNHTQSFSPAGTQCLTSTIHNTQSLCYLPGCFRPQSPTPQAKLCAFSQNSLAAQSYLNTELYTPPHTELCPPYTELPLLSLHRTIIFRNTELVIEHRACNQTQSFIYRTQSFICCIPRLEKITEAYI